MKITARNVMHFSAVFGGIAGVVVRDVHVSVFSLTLAVLVVAMSGDEQ